MIPLRMCLLLISGHLRREGFFDDCQYSQAWEPSNPSDSGLAPTFPNPHLWSPIKEEEKTLESNTTRRMSYKKLCILSIRNDSQSFWSTFPQKF